MSLGELKLSKQSKRSSQSTKLSGLPLPPTPLLNRKRMNTHQQKLQLLHWQASGRPKQLHGRACTGENDYHCSRPIYESRRIKLLKNAAAQEASLLPTSPSGRRPRPPSHTTWNLAPLVLLSTPLSLNVPNPHARTRGPMLAPHQFPTQTK